ncbi:MAG: glycosyl transferase family 2 [Flavipsychrobacter sp.]|nr:glycosyl transferase family 2 [Flavipsychrobacter sp.]
MSNSFTTYNPEFIKHSACVIVPTYNNEKTLKQVLISVLEYTDRVIVVNDGSTDSTSQILAQFPQIAKVEYPNNKGKGKALRTGFDHAISLGYDYAITIDSDGQHFASDLPLFLEKLETEKEAIIIGSRNLHQENMPGKNTFANKFSNFWYYVETGQKALDTQSGYRLYPIHLMKGMAFFGTKYEFEVEVLVRCAWKGIKVMWIPVTVYYAPRGERISHFRPSIDFSRISVLNTILVLIAFLYIKPRDLILKMSKIKNVKEMLRKNLFNKEESAIKKAASIGFGVFMGIVPIWGFQMAVALVLAALFKLNKALTLIASNISIPPMIPFIVFFSFLFGKVWMGGKSVSLIFNKNITTEAIKLNIQQYIFGSITLAVVAGLLAFGITYSALQVSGKIAARKSGKTQ